MKKNRSSEKIKKHYLTYLFFIGFASTGIYSVYTLRQNNLKMLSLREQVFEADKNNGDVNKALLDLRQFVTTHMNTSLPKTGDQKAIQLKYTYDRLVLAEEQRMEKDRQKISDTAKNVCKDVSGQLAKVDCEQNYIQNNPIAKKMAIPKELYSFDFISPKWSYDRAGISMLASGVFLILWLSDLFLRYLIKKKRQD